jgi:hypothetical protein
MLGGDDVGQVIDPGLPAAITAEAIQRMVTFQRYESTSANRFFRILHELERWQRMRLGERLPAPVAVDISVHAETGAVDSVKDGIKLVDSVSPISEVAENPPSELEGQRMRSGERLPAPTVVDVSVHAETGTVDTVHGDTEIVESVSDATETVDSVPAALEQPKALPGDEE